MSAISGFALLVDAALKGTLVLAAATAVVIILRRGSAARRHLVWQLAVIAMLGLPFIKAFSPLRLPLLPQLRSPIVRMDNARPSPAAQPEASAAPVNAAPAIDKSTVASNPQPLNNASPSVTTSDKPAVPLGARVLSWLGMVWLIVAGVLLLRLAVGFVLVRWFALRAYPLYEAGWAEANADLSALMGLKRPVQLFASPHIATPMTWGVTHPIIMLPSSAEDWTEERRRVVLLHELAHIRRADSLSHIFAQIACAVYWFHPLVWNAAARMRAEAERAADDLVLRAGTKASVYADHLLELIRTIGGMRTPALALPMAQRSTFEGRLLAILEPHLDRTTPRPLSVVGMVALVGLVIFPLAGLTTASGIPTETAHLSDDIGSVDKSKHGTSAKRDEKTKSTPTERAMAGLPNTDASNFAPPMSAAVQNTINSIVEYAQHSVDARVAVSANSAVSQSAQSAAAMVGPLIAALSDTDVQVRASAAHSLGQLEDTLAVRALSNALRNDTDAGVRKMAAWALGQIEAEEAIPALTHALKNDRDIEVRRTAVWALGQIEDSAAVPALTDALDDADSHVRSMAVWAMGQIEDRSAVPALVRVLKNGDDETRKHAAWALGQIEDASAVAGLAGALRDSNAEVRNQAVWALGQIESSQAVEPLGALANDANPNVRKQVAWALGQIEDASAVPILATMLRDKDPEVRHMAAWALGQIEARPVPQALLDALKDSDRTVRASAAWALGQIEDPNSATALRAALSDTDQSVRKAVLHALVQIGDQLGVEAIADMLKDPDPEIRRAAAAAMGGRHSPNPRPMPRPQPRPQPRPMN